MMVWRFAMAVTMYYIIWYLGNVIQTSRSSTHSAMPSRLAPFVPRIATILPFTHMVPLYAPNAVGSGDDNVGHASAAVPS